MQLGIDNYVKKFYDIIYTAINLYVPKSKICRKKYPSWYDKSTINLLKTKNKAYKTLKQDPSTSNYDCYSARRRKCKITVNNNRMNYVRQTELNITTNIKSLWKFVDEQRNSYSLPNEMHYNDLTSSDGVGIAIL